MNDLMQLSRNRWQEILGRLGIDQALLNGKHAPCPMCTGRIESDSPITMATANTFAISAATAPAGI